MRDPETQEPKEKTLYEYNSALGVVCAARVSMFRREESSKDTWRVSDWRVWSLMSGPARYTVAITGWDCRVLGAGGWQYLCPLMKADEAEDADASLGAAAMILFGMPDLERVEGSSDDLSGEQLRAAMDRAGAVPSWKARP